VSGLRTNLEAWALEHGTEVSTQIAANEAAVRRRIRARRRTRAAALVTAALAAVVGVVLAASALQPLGGAPAADKLPRHLSELVCGHAWLVERGSTSFVDEPDYYFDAPQGTWLLTTADGETEIDFSGYTAGEAAISWRGDMRLRHHAIARARVVAVKAGAIVGVTEEQYARIGEHGAVSLDVNAPVLGRCGGTGEDSASGDVAYHLVIQLTRVDDAAIIATIVDPSGAKAVEITPAP